MALDFDQILEAYKEQYPPTLNTAQVAEMLGSTAEVVRTKDVGFPGFSLESSGILFSFPNFNRDKIGVSWSSGPVWGLSDISLSTYYQSIDKESASIFDFPGFFSNSFTQSKIDTIGFNAQSIAYVGKHHLTFGFDFYDDNVDDTALSSTCSWPTSRTSI